MAKLEARIPNEARVPGNGELGHSDFNRQWPKRPLSGSAGLVLRTLHNRGLWLAACGLWLLLSACEVSPSEQFTPQLVVHGFVTANGIGVGVRTNINRTYAIDEPFDTIFADVSGMVWRGVDTWPLVHDVRDNYNTSPIFPSPAPGDTFGIRVAKERFDTVFGQTVVPDSFHILFPRAGDTATMSDSMVWTRSRNCAGYYMSFRSVDQGDTFYYSLAIPNDTTGNNFDSLRFTFPQMVFLYQFKPGIHTLRVYALDTNYFDWVSAGGFGFGSGTGETTRLSGGLGVFGSMVGESVKVVVRTDTAFRQAAKPVSRSQNVEFRMPEGDGWDEGIGRAARQGPQRSITKLEARIPNEARMPGDDELGHPDFNRHWPNRPLSYSAGFGLRVWPRPSLAATRTRDLPRRLVSRPWRAILRP